MRVIGIITTAVVAVIVLLALFVGLRSLPDLKRYLAIRRM